MNVDRDVPFRGDVATDCHRKRLSMNKYFFWTSHWALSGLKDTTEMQYELVRLKHELRVTFLYDPRSGRSTDHVR